MPNTAADPDETVRPMPPLRGCLLTVGQVLLVGVVFTLPFLFSACPAIVQIKRNQAHLRQPAVYLPVGKELAQLCQAATNQYLSYFEPSHLPPAILRQGFKFVSVSRTLGSIDLGGGHLHFGYRVALDRGRSSAAMQLWRLTLYEEDRQEPLTEILVPVPCEVTGEWE